MSEQKSDSDVKSVTKIHIEDEMRGAYLDYAMSVIVGRALPDVRDGLKPVHRRLLFTMHELSLGHNKSYKKSARVVGDALGKYHPHSDTSVYDAMVRLAQDFSIRYPLIDGQGNFGSVDGDSPAAMRYTEVRMERITEELLGDIEKDTVDFGPNYDDSLQEPKLLPAKIPNLLINGSSGIAVGMATNIPPHNLTEVLDATLLLIESPETGIEDILKIIKGPDFPTSGQIFGTKELRDAYRTGRGSVIIRGKAEIESIPGKTDRERIIITELPYQVNKAKLIEKIAEHVKEKRIEGISDLRDESSRDGMRVVIEIKRAENATVILNQLYKLTQLQDSFGIIFLAIQNNQPKVFNIKEMLWAFVEHRKNVVFRRTSFELKKAEARAHILEGLKKAVDHIDEVIALIKAAGSPDIAHERLMAKFDFSDLQAKAILEMRLQRLTGLERDNLVSDLNEVLAMIQEYRRILGSEEAIFEVIRNELLDIKRRYGDARRTQILMDEMSDFEIEDLIADEATIVSITHTGYVKRADLSSFRRQGRGGKGVRGVSTTEEDFVTSIYNTTTLSSLLCFTDKGRVYSLKVFKIPDASRQAKGRAIVNLLSLAPGEKVQAILPVRKFEEDEFVAMVTKAGVIKKTSLKDFESVRASGIIAIGIDDKDELVSAKVTNGKSQFLLTSQQGMAIRFDEEDVRPTGRSSRGVTGMSLDDGDFVVSMEALWEPTVEGESKGPIYEILTVTDLGYGKRTPVNDYRLIGRGGKGVTTMKTTDKNGLVVAARKVLQTNDLMLVSNKGQMIRIHVGSISEQGRNTQGVRLMNVNGGEKVVAVELVAEEIAPPEGSPTEIIPTDTVPQTKTENTGSNEE